MFSTVGSAFESHPEKYLRLYRFGCTVGICNFRIRQREFGRKLEDNGHRSLLITYSITVVKLFCTR